jgi:hypothetical protein
MIRLTAARPDTRRRRNITAAAIAELEVVDAGELVRADHRSGAGERGQRHRRCRPVTRQLRRPRLRSPLRQRLAVRRRARRLEFTSAKIDGERAGCRCGATPQA